MLLVIMIYLLLLRESLPSFQIINIELISMKKKKTYTQQILKYHGKGKENVKRNFLNTLSEKSNGFTLIEVLVSVLVLTFILFSLLFIFKR
ncbi:prepilin-type N-terminal cleavage/methylation domain-containing protein, partial [bacterium]|nr:prepilin-type N-terminal cleavage/methylation domain-containing protein [bacterium]